MSSGAATTESFLDLPEVRLRFIQSGRGAPVILVHGYMVDADYQWVDSGVLDRLANRFHVYAYDNRGHGKSEKFYEPRAYGLELANDVFRFMDGLRIERAHIVGYSMGAMIVARCLVMRRDRFLSATLGGGAGRFAWTSEQIAQNEADAHDMRRGDITRHLLRLWPADAARPSDEELKQLSDRALAGKDAEALACVRVSMEPLAASREALAVCLEPLLGIAGTADPFLASLERLKEAMPSLELVRIPGASHDDAPAAPAFHAALESFLLEHSGSGVA